MWRAVRIAVEAAKIANSKEPVNPAYAAALADGPEEAEDVLYEINSERAVARAMERIAARGFPG
jgi:hypothetical protein